MNSKINSVYNTLKRIDSYFNLANVKASLLASTNAVFLGIVLGNQSELSTLFTNNGLEVYYPYFSSGVLVFTSISTIFSLSVIFAFLKSGNKESTYKSCIYFGSIKNMKLDDFRKKIKKSSEEDYLEDLTRQVHLLSKALHKKYILLNISCLFFSFSILLIIIFGCSLIWG